MLADQCAALESFILLHIIANFRIKIDAKKSNISSRIFLFALENDTSQRKRSSLGLCCVRQHKLTSHGNTALLFCNALLNSSVLLVVPRGNQNMYAHNAAELLECVRNVKDQWSYKGYVACSHIVFVVYAFTYRQCFRKAWVSEQMLCRKGRAHTVYVRIIRWALWLSEERKCLCWKCHRLDNKRRCLFAALLMWRNNVENRLKQSK